MELKLVMHRVVAIPENMDEENASVHDRGSNIEFNYDTELAELKICGSNMYDNQVFNLDELKNIIRIIDKTEEITNDTKKR